MRESASACRQLGTESPSLPRIFEACGRQGFVPLIGFNAVYRYGGGQGQTSISYIIGRDGAGEKMAPFFVGDGAKRYTGLGAREHSVRVRK